MHLTLLQHVSFETPGSILAWARQRGHTVTVHDLSRGDGLPAAQDIEALVLMGGPMSVNDEALYPWLVTEKALIRELLAQQKPLLGICLGAQLIASAQGARVYPNHTAEIGFFPIAWGDNPFGFVGPMTVLHWHGETFDLVPGARLLARSADCLHQVVQWGPRVYGLQCHLEADADTVAAMLAHCGHELDRSGRIQTTGALQASADIHLPALQRAMAQVLDVWLGG